MKKHQSKNNKQNKTKIQLKIKSKNVTNNFILTPRAVSPRDYREVFEKKERFAEDIRSDKLKLEELASQKQLKETKRPQYRMITTDHTKGNIKKRLDDEQTGTQTPMVKRLSQTAQNMNKKKSYHSLSSTQRGLRKKNSDRFSKAESGELSKTMFSRVLGIIIKDFQEGKLKYKQLQQTLIELYDRTQRKKSMSKKNKKKDYGYSTFSNQFLKSTQQQGRSQIIMKKTKKSEDDLQISERVLEKQGFVNKIIVKGITTSTFLKDDVEGSTLKQKQGKIVYRQPSFNIHTSNSIKEINQQMRFIQQKFKIFCQDKNSSVEDIMATKIQRAWRRYRTRKLVKSINSQEANFNIHDILDQFTDEQQNCIQQIYETKERQNSKAENIAEIQYNQLVKLVSQSLKSNKMSKQQCLKNILSYLKIPNKQLHISQSIKIEGQQKSIIQQSIESKVELSNELINQQHSQEMQMSRVKIIELPIQQNQIKRKQINQQNINNEDQINSFTNKYSSKEVYNNQYFKDNKSITQESSQLDKSLTFTHSQTVATQNFKMINIKNIQEGLRTREEAINIKKQKQIQQLTERLFCSKINKEEYQVQKQKIDKWFKTQQKQLKKVKNSLLKSCNEARKILQNVQTELKTQKSRKMLKCLSDKYIKKNNWSLNINNLEEKKKIPVKKLKCEQNEEQLRTTHFQSDDIQSSNNQYQTGDYLIFNKKDSLETQLDTQKFQITPKLFRSISIEVQSNDYNYEQIEKAIDEDDEGIEQGLIKYQKKIQLQSDKFIASEQQCQGLMEEHQISLINNLVNQQKKRFKYLCAEDKEDIFQFLFLDLVLQMFTQSLSGQTKIIRCAQLYNIKAKRLKKIPKGIKTNLAASKEYLRILSKYVLSHKQALKNLSIPMGPSAIEMLKYMRDQFIQADDQQSISSTLVIPLEIFQKVSRLPQLQLKLQRYYQDQQKELGRLSFLRTALNINNKSLFDSLNEMLDHQRPYGVWGKPFPWKKMLSLDRQWSKLDQQTKMKKCIQKTIQSCSYLCGIIVDKEDSLFGTHRVSEQYVMQIRQDRLSKMLANELLQNQERWIFYDDEQTQILMEVSSFITKKLIKELVLQIVSLRMKF